MEVVSVSTQQELDAAIAANPDAIVELRGDGRFVVRDSSQVRACDSSQITVYDSSQVTAYGSSQVRAYGSSQVRACGSSQVRAYDSSQVRACDSSQITAYGSSQVTATAYVAVTVYGEQVDATGSAHVIRIPRLATPQLWCEFYGVAVDDTGVVRLFKAVGDDFCSSHGTDYSPGLIPVADDWDGGKKECGGGLHFCPRPFMALRFCPAATRFVACPVSLADIVVHPDGDTTKVKARGCCFSTWECDIDGNPI